MEIVIASNNFHKISEFKGALEKYGVKIYSLNDLNIHVEVDETGKTFKENAFLKAEAISKLTDKVVVADDSGLEVRALDNFPGIYSARFMEGHPYSEKFVAINKMLDGKLDRYARFNSTLCVMNLKPEPLYFVGYAEGEVLKKPQGESSFGYDPIFYSYKAKKTFAELSQDEKNAVSHRGEAIKALVKYLEENNYIHEKL